MTVESSQWRVVDVCMPFAIFLKLCELASDTQDDEGRNYSL